MTGNPWGIHWPGSLTVIREADGSVTLGVETPGPMLVSVELAKDADPQWLSLAGDVLTFRGNSGGKPVELRYRVVGREGGWLLTRPIEGAP